MLERKRISRENVKLNKKAMEQTIEALTPGGAFKLEKAVARIAEKAEELLKYNPSAIVAVERSGTPTVRLLQHYIKRKTGERFPVYILHPGSRSELMMEKPEEAHFILPENEEKIKGETRLAIVDELRAGGGTMRNVEKFFRDKIRFEGETKQFIMHDPFGDIGYANILKTLPLEEVEKAIDESREHGTFFATQMTSPSRKGKELGKEHRLAQFIVYKDALDDWMNKQGIGKDSRT